MKHEMHDVFFVFKSFLFSNSKSFHVDWISGEEKNKMNNFFLWFS